MLEAPFPLPAQAKCPFCAAVFAPAEQVPTPPAVLAPAAPNPYQAPASAGLVPPRVSADAGGQLVPPAIALLVTGSMWALWAAFNWIGVMAQQKPPPPPPFMGSDQQSEEMWALSFRIARYIGPVLILMGLVIVLGAIAMLRRRAFGLAMTGSIVAMLPGSACCLLGLPFGIWAIVVLNKTEVKSTFF